MAEKHMTKQDAYETQVNKLEEIKDGRWMSVLFWEEDGQVYMLKTTSEFDRNNFPQCVKQLKDNCVQEMFGETNIKPPKLPRFDIGGLG